MGKNIYALIFIDNPNLIGAALNRCYVSSSKKALAVRIRIA